MLVVDLTLITQQEVQISLMWRSYGSLVQSYEGRMKVICSRILIV